MCIAFTPVLQWLHEGIPSQHWTATSLAGNGNIEYVERIIVPLVFKFIQCNGRIWSTAGPIPRNGAAPSSSLLPAPPTSTPGPPALFWPSPSPSRRQVQRKKSRSLLFIQPGKISSSHTTTSTTTTVMSLSGMFRNLSSWEFWTSCACKGSSSVVAAWLRHAGRWLPAAHAGGGDWPPQPSSRAGPAEGARPAQRRASRRPRPWTRTGPGERPGERPRTREGEGPLSEIGKKISVKLSFCFYVIFFFIF